MSEIELTEEHQRATLFANDIISTILDYVAKLNDRNSAVVKLATPEGIYEAFAKKEVSLSLSENAKHSNEKLVEACKLTFEYSVKTGHPLFFNQLYARADVFGVVAEWITSVLNTNLHTYEVAPVFTLMEREVIRKFGNAVGGNFATDDLDGLLVPGGSIANLYAVHLARFAVDPDFAARGAIGGPHLVAFTSAESHYSYLKSARLLGIGTNNLIKVECDAKGRMLPDKLEEAILAAKKEGKTPFFCGATYGTTVLGGFDPIPEINNICKKHNVWLHIDAAWGGIAFYTTDHKDLIADAEKADSIAWNAHKVMGVPIQCSLFITHHKDMLKQCNCSNAAYLFQPDKNFSEYDIGDKTIQCGRHVDAFKLWFTWKAHGDDLITKMFNQCFVLANHTISLVEEANKKDNSLLLAFKDLQFTNVCFWYIPKKYRPFNVDTATKEEKEAIGKVAPRIKDRMQKEGKALIGFQPLGGKPNFFRIVFASCWYTTQSDVEKAIADIIEIGDSLEV